MNFEGIRNILNILFMLLTVAAIITYFAVGDGDTRIFIYVCGLAVVVKMMEFVIRFTRKR